MKKRSVETVVLLCIFTLGVLSLCLTHAWADETAKAAREILSKYKDAVITVELTTEQGMSGGRKTEGKSEVTGTVINPAGLTVLSLFSTDESALYNAYASEDAVGEAMAGFKWESQIKDVRMIMADGKEIPAQIVLRDKDLDLAFVRPVEKLSKPISALELSNATTPQAMDQVIVLNRLGKVASRVPSVSLSRIQATVEKPRTFYVPGTEAILSGLGVPVFSLDGKVTGLLVLRVMQSREFGSSGMFSGLSGMGMLPIVLPAQDILDVAKQVPEAKAEKKAEEKKQEETKQE